jgi:chorismate-pyruvate lyase
MVDAYFTHRAARMPHLEDVAIDVLDPFLRALLFTDGTVTRALEAHVLQRANVECVEQFMVRAPRQTATFLEMDEGALALRRRVAITAADIPMVWAESFIVPERMPAGFAEMLDSAHRGIGEFLQRARLESVRELLTCGIGPPPQWAPGRSSSGLTRFYRIITQNRPTLLIAETFPIEIDSGLYHLKGLAKTT